MPLLTFLSGALARMLGGIAAVMLRLANAFAPPDSPEHSRPDADMETPSDGPPSHWLERVRKQSPPEHWLRDIESRLEASSNAEPAAQVTANQTFDPPARIPDAPNQSRPPSARFDSRRRGDARANPRRPRAQADSLDTSNRRDTSVQVASVDGVAPQHAELDLYAPETSAPEQPRSKSMTMDKADDAPAVVESARMDSSVVEHKGIDAPKRPNNQEHVEADAAAPKADATEPESSSEGVSDSSKTEARDASPTSPKVSKPNESNRQTESLIERSKTRSASPRPSSANEPRKAYSPKSVEFANEADSLELSAKSDNTELAQADQSRPEESGDGLVRRPQPVSDSTEAKDEDETRAAQSLAIDSTENEAKAVEQVAELQTTQDIQGGSKSSVDSAQESKSSYPPAARRGAEVTFPTSQSDSLRVMEHRAEGVERSVYDSYRQARAAPAQRPSSPRNRAARIRPFSREFGEPVGSAETAIRKEEARVLPSSRVFSRPSQEMTGEAEVRPNVETVSPSATTIAHLSDADEAAAARVAPTLKTEAAADRAEHVWGHSPVGQTRLQFPSLPPEFGNEGVERDTENSWPNLPNVSYSLDRRTRLPRKSANRIGPYDRIPIEGENDSREENVGNWPRLPERRLSEQTGDEWQAESRRRKRIQRLDEEQRGVLWNESPF